MKKSKMIIGVYVPNNRPTSYKVVTENICKYLSNKDIELIYFETITEIPQADIIWNPNVGGGYISDITKKNTEIPIVITVHGARLFSLKIKDLNKNQSYIKILYQRILQQKLWRKHKNDFEAIFTVSEFSKNEISKYLKLDRNKIYVAYNAIDKNLFKPNNNNKKYFLHISEYQQVKNLNRLISAYLNVVKINDNLPDFWIVSRNFPNKFIHKKIKILEDKYRTTEQIVELYQNAFAFLFPSLHEGFGLPLVEAMACGTPVITSNITACPEIVADAALIVNPYKITEISNAIIKLSNDEKLYVDLQYKGIKRAKFFLWQKTAEIYRQIFKKIYDKKCAK